MNTIKIKPAKGMLVRDPQTGRPLDAKGETKPRSSYWLRRLCDDDVQEVQVSRRQESRATDVNESKNGGKFK